MHVRVHLFVHTHTHTHTSMYLYTQTHTQIHTSMYLYTHTHTHTHVFVCTHITMYLYVYIHACTRSSICAHTHTSMYLYTHTHTHTHQLAQLDRATECTNSINCISTEGLDFTNECPGYDTKQSDDQIPVMLELWRMQSTHSLLSFPGPLRSGVVVPDRVLCIGQIELNC